MAQQYINQSSKIVISLVPLQSLCQSWWQHSGTTGPSTSAQYYNKQALSINSEAYKHHCSKLSSKGVCWLPSVMKSSCKSRDGWINNQHIQRQRKSAERIYGGFGWSQACIGRYKALPTNYADYQQKHFQDSLKDKFKRLGYLCKHFSLTFI